jgi:hypothetical protein
MIGVMNGTGSGLYPKMQFEIRGVEPSGSTFREIVRKYILNEKLYKACVLYFREENGECD